MDNWYVVVFVGPDDAPRHVAIGKGGKGDVLIKSFASMPSNCDALYLFPIPAEVIAAIGACASL